MNVFNLRIEKYKGLFFFAVVFLYAFIAYKSSGFHHPDEHFQVIEFAKYKMGETKASELAWEFEAQIRSALQPTLCLLVFKVLRVLHIHDPYLMAFVLRLITAFFSIYVLYRYTNGQLDKIAPNFQGLFLFLSFFLWIIPYVSVRFSSETWSALFFLLGIIQLQCHSRHRFLIVGILFGISVLFRYQSGVMVVGLTVWLLIIERIRIKYITQMAFAVMSVMIMGFLIDMWFYGKVAFTAYNYFRINIVDGVASNFGVSPWYTYFLYILQGLGYPLGIFVLLSLLYLIRYRWKEKEVWIIVSFILVHSLIPHKEPRFLFPIAFFSGFVMISFVQYLYHLSYKSLRIIVPFLLVVSLLTNAIGIIVVSGKTAGNGQNAIGEFIHKKYAGKKVSVVYLEEPDVHWDWPFPRNTFYRNEEIQMKKGASIWQENFTDAIDGDVVNLLMLPDRYVTGPRFAKKMTDLQFKPVFQSISTVSQFFLNLYKPENNDNVYLYEWQQK